MHTPAHFEQLVDIARQAGVHPVVTATFRLDQGADAQEELRLRRHVGKIVLLPRPCA